VFTKLIAATATALVLTTATVQARSWVLLSYGNRTCEFTMTAPAGMRTPLEAEYFYRRLGVYVGTEVSRTDNGEIEMARVSRSGPDGMERHLDYFISMSRCRTVAEFLGSAQELN
jgi:hypothetical protein